METIVRQARYHPKALKPICLNTNAEMSFLPIVLSFSETGALAFGLGAAEATALQLAAEELFVHLCQTSSAGKEVEIQCTSGGHYVRMDFIFAGDPLDMRACNLTYRVSIDDEKSLDQMGLMLASRLVDRFESQQEANGDYRMILVKEKAYPQTDGSAATKVPQLVEHTIRPAQPEEIKLLCHQVVANYGPQHYPASLARPGKAVDMAANGDWEVRLAADQKGFVGGGIFWKSAGERTVECFGPFVFHQKDSAAMAKDLMDQCIGAMARTPTVGLICRRPTPELPRDYFELLGRQDIVDATGQIQTSGAYFRQMQDDPGCAVWGPPDFEGFLHQTYQQLFLAREIRLIQDQGEHRQAGSVLSAEVDRVSMQATLTPVRAGRDMHRNLADHVAMFEREKMHMLSFEMDLAVAWQVEFGAALAQCGFTPKLVLPYGRSGDLLIFQRKGVV